ncbi:MAG: VWA domain-containing protein [Candidatus Dadabacteria bacterium]|nr:MAG: VWA domain-containing protein [Candidatus Dadabacteria bacterium]
MVGDKSGMIIKCGGERGAALFIFSLFLGIILGVAALVFGMGFLLSSHSRVQNLSNLVALGVLEEVIKDQSDANAESRANEIAGYNKVIGANSFDGICAGSQGCRGGRIEYGIWHYQDPDGTGPLDPCGALGKSYPCFEPTPSFISGTVNSVRATIRNKPRSNPIIVPFGGLFGMRGGRVERSAIATVAGQCTLFLQDVSASVTFDTHLQDGTGKEALYVFPDSVLSATCPSSDPAEDIWCNMRKRRPVGSIPDPQVHYKSDYVLHDTVLSSSQVLVDSYVDAVRGLYIGPQPYTTLFLASNLASRRLKERSVGSFWRAAAFDTAARGWFPESDFAPEAGPIINITNINNRGTYNADGSPVTDELHPNVIDLGWIPSLDRPVTDATNIIAAFEQAILAFKNSAVCPSSYKKVVVLATDGIGNCYKYRGMYICPVAGGQDSYDYFLRFKYQLENTVIPQLKSEDISVVVLFSGSHSDPHFINILAPQGFNTKTGSAYLSLDEAYALGYTENDLFLSDLEIDSQSEYNTWCSDPSNCPTSKGCSSLYCKNGYVLNNLSRDVAFREAATVMSKLARETGGVFCPLLPTDPNPSHYIDNPNDPSAPKVLDDAYRKEGKPQRYAIEMLFPQQQAFDCIKRVFQTKYVLVEEE